MEPTTQNNTLRSLLIFVVIGAVLLGAVILGVRWARGRSDQLANAGNQQQTEQPASETQEQAPAEQPQPAPAAQPQPTPAPEQNKPATQTPLNQPVPAQVPSTGIEDAFLPIVAIAAMAFAGTTYIQSRRRLAPAK